MRATETILDVLAFVMVVAGSALYLTDIRRTNGALARIITTAKGLPAGEEDDMQRVLRVISDPGVHATWGLTDLAETLTPSGFAVWGAVIAVAGGAIGLAAALLSVWT